MGVSLFKLSSTLLPHGVYSAAIRMFGREVVKLDIYVHKLVNIIISS